MYVGCKQPVTMGMRDQARVRHTRRDAVLERKKKES